jgi:hypothetical protein
MHCAASHALEQGLPDTDSAHSIEGTRAHTLASDLLSQGIYMHDDEFIPPPDMVEHIQGYVGRVLALAKTMGLGFDQIEVEQRVDCRELVPHCYGTADVILSGHELVAIDLKYGMGVQVDAYENEQGMLYLLGAYLERRFAQSWSSGRVIIDQPRKGGISEYPVSIPDLLAFGERAKAAAEKALYLAETQPANLQEFATPGEKQCRWCKALPFCQAARDNVTESMRAEWSRIDVDENGEPIPVVDAEVLGAAMSQTAFVEHWIKAVRAEVHRQLVAGVAVPGWKLVQGRQGNREWSDEAEADKVLAAARLKKEQRYKFELISPAAAEKLLKAKPRLWAKAQKLITRSEGSMSVAPESDKRPAHSIASEFKPIEQAEPAHEQFA